MTTITIAADNETHLITRFKTSPKVVCSTFCMGLEEPPVLKKWDEGLEEFVGDILNTPNINIVGHNIAYDCRTWAATFPKLTKDIFKAYRAFRITDTGIRQQLWDIARGNVGSDDKLKHYSLAWLVKIIFDEEVAGKTGDDIWRLRYSELENVPSKDWPEAATAYALGDAVYTYRLWDAQNEAQDEIRGEFEKTFTAFCLSLAECRGMRTSPEKVRAFENKHRTALDELTPALVEAGLLAYEKGKYVKKAKVAQARIRDACEAKGLKVPMTPKGLAVATDKVACLVSQDELMLQRVKYSVHEKMMSTYLPIAKAGTEGPIATRFAMAGTGRTTSSAPSKPLIGGNLQNAPRAGGFRECHVPRPGYVFGAADFSGAELHTLAQKCYNVLGYSVLGDKLNNKEDVHAYVGSTLLGVSEADFSEMLENKDKDAKNARQDAKAANFGFPGGMHEKTFILTQLKQRARVWTFAEAKRLRQAWLTAFPEMSEYFDYCKRELGPMSDAVIELNRIGMLRRVRTFNQLANSYFQGGAACGALEALCEVVYRCMCVENSALCGSFLCNFVHDENILEIPLDGDPHAAVTEMAEIMVTEFSKSTPDYPVRVEPVLMSYWSKDAEPTFGPDGRLIPWRG